MCHGTSNLAMTESSAASCTLRAIRCWPTSSARERNAATHGPLSGNAHAWCSRTGCARYPPTSLAPLIVHHEGGNGRSPSLGIGKAYRAGSSLHIVEPSGSPREGFRFLANRAARYRYPLSEDFARCSWGDCSVSILLSAVCAVFIASTGYFPM